MLISPYFQEMAIPQQQMVLIPTHAQFANHNQHIINLPTSIQLQQQHPQMENYHYQQMYQYSYSPQMNNIYCVQQQNLTNNSQQYAIPIQNTPYISLDTQQQQQYQPYQQHQFTGNVEMFPMNISNFRNGNKNQLQMGNSSTTVCCEDNPKIISQAISQLQNKDEQQCNDQENFTSKELQDHTTLEDNRQYYNNNQIDSNKLGEENNWINEYIQISSIAKLFSQRDSEADGYDPKDLHNLFRLKEGKQNQVLILPKMMTKEEHLHRLSKLQKKQSKFHNKNKVFLNKIIKFFLKNNLKNLNIPEKLLRKIIIFMKRARFTGRSSEKSDILKLNVFNHQHYNLLFLKLNAKNIQILKPKDKKLHKEVFDLDLDNIDISQIEQNQTIQYVNFLKRCVYQIFDYYLKGTLIGDQSQEEEREYEIRAIRGIQHMINGVYINRF